MATLLAEAYLHRLDPFLIEFPEGWPLGGLRWYGVAYLAGFAVGWLIVRWLARTHRTAIPQASVADLMIYVLVGVLAGGRLGYCLFYEPRLLVEFTSSFPYWGLLAINKGGMASHGGMLGVITAVWIFAVRGHLSKLHLFDVMALICPPGLFFGRLANFVNAELVGRALPADRQGDPPWWSLKFAQEIKTWTASRLPELTPAVEAVNVSAAEWRMSIERMATDEGSRYFVDAVCDRIIAQVQAGNEQVIEILRPMLEATYPSQLIQAFTDGPVLMGVLVLAWWGPRKPGVVGCWFLIAYGMMRVLSELVREPDAEVALLPTPLGDLSRGQTLSILMIITGLVALPIVMKREVEPIGGLAPTK